MIVINYTDFFLSIINSYTQAPRGHLYFSVIQFGDWHLYLHYLYLAFEEIWLANQKIQPWEIILGLKGHTNSKFFLSPTLNLNSNAFYPLESKWIIPFLGVLGFFFFYLPKDQAPSEEIICYCPNHIKVKVTKTI